MTTGAAQAAAVVTAAQAAHDSVSGWCGHVPEGARTKCDQCPGCAHSCHQEDQ